MNGLFLVVSGIALGALLGVLRPSLRLGAGALFSVLLGSLPPLSAASSASVGNTSSSISPAGGYLCFRVLRDYPQARPTRVQPIRGDAAE